MKAQHLIIVLIATLIMLSGCKEITVKTTVHEDGSFTRVLIIHSGDSTSAYDKDLPYPVDASWEQAYMLDTTNSEKPHKVTYTKTFSNSESLNSEIDSDTSWYKNLDREIDIRKKFGFFYSYLSFTETIKAANPFTNLDYRDYLSEEDINLLNSRTILKTKGDTLRFDKAEENFEYYMSEALTLGIINELENGIEKLNISTLDPGMVINYKDSIYKKVADFGDESNAIFIDYYAEWTRNKDVEKLKEIEPPLFEETDKQMEQFVNVFMMDSYTQFVELPGLLTETNSINPVGNQVSWTVGPFSYILEDYTIYAESRVINYWAFVLSGIVFLGLILMLLIKTFRK